MKKSKYFILASTITIFFLFCGSIISSCSSDDTDYNNSVFYTLADREMTRAGESPTPYVPAKKDSTVMCQAIDTTVTQVIGVYADADVHIKSGQEYKWNVKPSATVTLSIYGDCISATSSTPQTTFNGNSIQTSYTVKITAKNPISGRIIYYEYSEQVGVPVQTIKVASK